MKSETIIVIVALVVLIMVLRKRRSEQSSGVVVPQPGDPRFDTRPPSPTNPPAQNPSFLDRLLGVGSSFAVSECVASGRPRRDCERITGSVRDVFR